MPTPWISIYLSPEYLSNFLSELYTRLWLGKIFRFMLLRLLGNAFATQKIESRHFYSCPPQAKFFHRFLSSLLRHREITDLPQALFFRKYVPQLKRGRKLCLQPLCFYKVCTSVIIQF